MSEIVARVHVRGPGLVVTDATEGAIAVVRRELVGIPLGESVPEYDEALRTIRAAVTQGVASSTVVRAPNGAIGRVVADPTPGGACVTFVPSGEAMQNVAGLDLVLGRANDVYRLLVTRPYLGIAAHDAFPEPEYREAQDRMRWVMRTGLPSVVHLASGPLHLIPTGHRVLTTVAYQRTPLPVVARHR